MPRGWFIGGSKAGSDWSRRKGSFTPLASGRGRIVGELAGQRVEVPAEVAAGLDAYMPSFVRDVNPVLSRVGCNAGTCHGAAKGKNGFKLSLRGYDPLFDHRALPTTSPRGGLTWRRPATA